MWWTIATCLLVLLALFLLLGNGRGVGWLVFAIIAFCVGSHIVMVFGHQHRHSGEENDNRDKDQITHYH